MENKQRLKEGAKSNAQLKHQPTLPALEDDKLVLSRQTTQSSIAFDGIHSSSTSIGRFSDREGNRLSAIPGINRPNPSRMASHSSVESVESFASDVPLMARANAVPSWGSNRNYVNNKPSLNRLMTQDSQHSQTSTWSSPISPVQYTESPYSYHISPIEPTLPQRMAYDRARSTTPASIGSQAQGHQALPQKSYHERDSYEMQSQANVSRMIDPAYRPSLKYSVRNQSSTMPTSRSATAPPQQEMEFTRSGLSRGAEQGQSRLTRFEGNGPIPFRSGTAPPRPSTNAAWAGERGALARHT